MRRSIHQLYFTMALICVTWAVASCQLWASSAHGGLVKVRQPDGTQIEVRNEGGEWFHWQESADGYVVAQDKDGFWKHARFQPDSTKMEIIPNAVVGRVSPRTLNLKKRDLPTASQVLRQVETLKGRQEVEKAPQISADAEPKEASPQIGTNISNAGQRRVRCVVILAAFNDHWDSATASVTSAKGKPPAQYDALFNESGYKVDGAVGSVRDYYLENSYNTVAVESLIVGWVRLPQNEAWYGDNDNEVDGEKRLRQMALDALAAADGAGFDFAAGDGDGNGFADIVHIIGSGHSEAWSGNPSTGIWPRHWWFENGYVLWDGIGIYNFSVSSALRGAASQGSSLCRIGEICHELGHQFGLPDLYDLGGQTQGVGTWCCMSHGSWGALSGATGDGRQPVHFSAHCKRMLGFVKPRVLHAEGQVDLPAVETHPEIHLIQDGSNSVHEHFLVENRQPVGFDSQLPAGLLIWHVKQDSRGNDSSHYSHPALRLEEAGGANSLAYSRYAEASHTWRADNGLTGGFRDETGNATSNAMTYQPESQYTRFYNTASRTFIRLGEFSPSGLLMRYGVQTVVPVLAPKAVVAPTYTVTWTDATAASVYEIQEGVPKTLTEFADGGEDAASFHDNWHVTGLARPSEGAAKTGRWSYMLATWDESASRRLSLSQSMELRQSFQVSPAMNLKFWVMSHIAGGYGQLRVELSKDDGASWAVLDRITGFVDPWTLKSYSLQQLNAVGISSGDRCRLRFVADTRAVWGWSGYPNFGFALDDLLLSGVEMAGHGDWRTLSANLSTPSIQMTGKNAGKYAYRVRALVDGLWRPFSPAGEVECFSSAYRLWVRHLPSHLQGQGLDPDGDGISNLMEYALGRNPANRLDVDGIRQLPRLLPLTSSASTEVVFELSLPASPPAEVTYEVQRLNIVSHSWQTIASKQGAGIWVGNVNQSDPVSSDGQRTVFRVTELLSGGASLQDRCVMRLRIVR
jgi:M6 family metalloprotease-like protein